MNKKYFRYLLKNYRIAIIFFFVLYFGMTAAIFIGNNPVTADDFNGAIIFDLAGSFLLAYALPVILFAFAHRRKSSDLYFALPISRKDQLITSIAFAFMICFGYFFITTLAMKLIMYSAYRFSSLLLVDLYAAFAILSLLIINTCLFMIGNNIFDGIVMIASYTALPILVTILTATFTSAVVAGRNSGSLDMLATYISPLGMHCLNISGLLEKPQLAGGNLGLKDILFPALWTLVGAWGLKVHFIDRKTERAEQLSDDPLAYRSVINIYAFGILAWLALEIGREPLTNYLIWYLILLFIYVVAQFVYKRKIHLEWKTLAVYAAGMVITILLGWFAWNSQGFGLGRSFTIDKGDYLRISYGCYNPESDLIGSAGSDTEFIGISIDESIAVKDFDRYAPALEILDRYRKQAINDFYTTGSEHYQTGYESSLIYTSYIPDGKYLNPNAGEIVNEYTYYMYEDITLSDLKTISRYLPVYVDTYSGESMMTLDEYLAMKGI